MNRFDKHRIFRYPECLFTILRAVFLIIMIVLEGHNIMLLIILYEYIIHLRRTLENIS